MADLVHAPPNEAPADEMWVWLSVDHKGEGLMAALSPIGNLTLASPHERMLPIMRKLAVEIVKASGIRARLVRFVRAEIVEEIGG